MRAFLSDKKHTTAWRFSHATQWRRSVQLSLGMTRTVLEVKVKGICIANIYVPNGNPVGSNKFAYKLAWMARLNKQMRTWVEDKVPTLVGGDFNVIPEDIDCHKPSSWAHDALFQSEPRAQYRSLLGLGYKDAFRSLHPSEGGHFTFWDYFRQASSTIEAYESIISCCRQRWWTDCKNARSINGRERTKSHRTTLRLS